MTCLENLGQSLLLQFPLEPGSLLFVLFCFEVPYKRNVVWEISFTVTSIDHVTWLVTESCTC